MHDTTRDDHDGGACSVGTTAGDDGASAPAAVPTSASAALIDDLPDSCIEFDRDLRAGYANRAARVAWPGLGASDDGGCAIDALLGNSARVARWRAAIEQVFTTRAVATFAETWPPGSGSRTLEHRCVPRLSDDGSAAAVAVVSRDVGSSALLLGLRHFAGDHERMLFDYAPLPMFLSDVAAAVIVRANARACDFLGYESGELDGMPLSTIAPDVDPALFERLLHLPESRMPVRSVRRLRTKRGAVAEMESTAMAVGGGLFISIGRDLSELHGLQAEVSLRERLLATAFATAGDIVVFIRAADRTIVFANERWEQHTGYTVAEAIGRSVDDFDFFVSNEEEQIIHDAIAGALVLRDGDVRYRVKSGSQHIAQVTTATVERDGEPHVLIVAHDVTAERAREAEVVRLNADLRSASARLEERVAQRTAELSVANAALDVVARQRADFVARLSHEVRTPLNGIQGFAELLHDGEAGPLSDAQRDYVAEILGCARHLARLAGGTLDIVERDQGRVALRVSEFSTAEVVREACSALAPVASARGVRVEVRIAPAARTLTADMTRVRQVLLNYLTNAIDFTSPGATVLLDVRRDEAGTTRIAVTDHGPGISADDQRLLFQPFVRLAGDATRAGHGLGLAVCRALAEAHGGATGVDSIVGDGSTFWATFADQRSMLPSSPPDPEAARPSTTATSR